MVQYCEKKGYACEELKAYVANRDTYLSDMMSANSISKDDAKAVVLSILNGGNSSFEKLTNKPSWLEAIKASIERIQQNILVDPECEQYAKVVPKNKFNRLGSVCNHLLCSIEDKILTSCCDFLSSKGCKLANVVLVFDGFMIPKDLIQVTPEFLAELSTYVQNTTQYSVEFLMKPMTEIIDVSSLEISEQFSKNETIVSDDNEAAAVFLERYEKLIKRSKGRTFIYTDDNKWTCQPNLVDVMLLKKALNSRLVKQNAKGDKTMPYSGDVKGAKHIVEAALANIRDDPEFADRLWAGSLGKLFFSDGYYDFDKMSFVKTLDPEESLTTIRINRPFPARDEAMMDEVRERVLSSIMPDPEMRDNFLAQIARGVAGRLEDKDWNVGIGERNCGKGVSAAINETAFQDYCITVISDQFMMESFQGGDEAKKLSWLLDCEFKRLIFTNEIKIDANNKKQMLNGNLIKGKLASGGDRLKARKNYQDEVEFRVQGRAFLFLNDLPTVTPADTLETVNIFNFPLQFVDKVDENSMPFMRVKDEAIKKYCERSDVADAYIHLVLDQYKKTKVKACESVSRETKTFRVDAGDEWTIIKDHFEVTKDETHKIHSRIVKEWLKEAKINLTAQKLRQRLEKMGAVYCDSIRIGSVNPSGYKFLKIKNEVVEEVEEDEDDF